MSLKTFFLVLAGLVALLSVGSPTAFDGDEGFELAKAHSVAAGYPLYSTVWCDHPPLHNLLLQGVFKLTGESELTAQMLAAVFSAVLLGGFHWLCARLAGTGVAAGAVGLFLGLGMFLPLAAAVLIIVPAYALALASVATFVVARERQSRAWLLVSGACMGLGLQTKFTAVLLFPLIALLASPAGEWLLQTGNAERGTQSAKLLPDCFSGAAWRAASGRCGWWLLGLTVAAGAVVAAVPEMLTMQLITPHFGSSVRSEFSGSLNEMWIMLGADWGLIGLALYGVARSVERGQGREVVLPAVWFLTTLAAHAVQKPFWSYYYFHLLLPLSWLAAVGLKHAWAALREVQAPQSGLRRAWWVVDAALVVGCLMNVIPTAATRSSSEIATLTHGHLDPAWHVVHAMQEFKPRTRWVYAEEPTLAAVAGLAMPPELSVVSIKRFACGDLTNQSLANYLAHYRPEQLLLRARSNESYEAMLRPFRQSHVLYRKFDGYELWVKAELLPAERRAAIATVSRPFPIAIVNPNTLTRP